MYSTAYKLFNLWSPKMLEITFKPRTPEQINAITAILPSLVPYLGDSADQAKPVEAAKKPRAPRSTSQPSRSEPSTEVSIVEVRSRLAEIAKSGKTEAVKALLRDFGAEKLTDVAAEHYAELLAAAEVL